MVKRIIHNKKTIIWLLPLILLLALFFRFYHLQNWLSFGMDQENELLIVKNIIEKGHFPAIGLSAGDTGLYRGPFFLYVAVIPFLFFKGNPIGGAILVSSLGVLVVYLIYFLGKRMFSEKSALIAAFFYAGSFLTAFYDRQFWNPSWIPLFSIILGYLIFKVLSGNTRVLPLLFLLFGISIHAHLSLLIFFPLIIFTVFIGRKMFSKKIIILSIFLLLLTQSSLIFFDIRHNFQNSSNLVNLIFKREDQKIIFSNISGRLRILTSTFGRFYSVPLMPDLFAQSGQCNELIQYKKNPYIFETLIVILGIVMSIIILNKKGISMHSNKIKNYISANPSMTIMGGIYFLTLVSVLIYNRQVFEYHYYYLFPWIAFTLGIFSEWLILKKHGKAIFYLFISSFLISNFLTFITSQYNFSYKDKMNAINFIKQNINNQPYTLEALGECPRFGGYRYLFEHILGYPPRSSYMDSYFGWLYQTNKEYSNQSLIVLLSLIDPRDKPENISKWEKEKISFITDNKILTEGRFGRIQVLILEPFKHI